MRFRSPHVGAFQVFAVSGVNTVSFAIKATAPTPGLLGFSVERSDPTENERRWMPGYKVFHSVIPEPDETLEVSTRDHPVQSFVWDDFTAKPGRDYEYIFHPLSGSAQELDRRAPAIPIKVRTEQAYSDAEHDVFFNRGVASSQAYRRRFGNRKPDALPEPKRTEALRWLSRDLDLAMLKFIGGASAHDTLLCCFYEFRYEPIAKALASAIEKGVRVRIIVDAKVNERTDSKGVFHESFPRTENLATIEAAGLPDDAIILRDANPTNIQHNKFMVLLRGAEQQPSEVWTGSTNVSLGGISGQTNVGHWVRNRDVAEQFSRYWELLSRNPGSAADDDASENRKKKAAYRKGVEKLGEIPDALGSIAPGVTPVFSPRSGKDILELYVELVDDARSVAAITLAFGVNDLFKEQLKDNTDVSGVVFMLLEKKDRPSTRGSKPFIAINASNNVYKAWGAYVKDPVYQWARETNARALGLNQHVSYIHSKFLLHDPLGDDPIVVTGSANFSVASTNSNDENMLIIRGDRRVADIYFTEFNRLFNHYYFRAILEDRHDSSTQDSGASLFLDESDGWIGKYAPGKLRAKRVAIFAGMTGFTDL